MPVDVRPELERPMLSIEVRGEHVRSFSFSRHTLGLGRMLPGLMLGADIGLGDQGVLARHVEIFEQEGRLRVFAHGPIRIEGKEREEAEDPSPRRRRRDRAAERKLGREVDIGDVIELVGSKTKVVITHFVPILPADYRTREGELLRAIEAAPSSVADRLVYADALEDSSGLIRAEYLRLQLRLLLDEPVEGDQEAKARYLKNLMPARSWVDRVGEPVIAGLCPTKQGRACPVRWGTAPPQPSVCATCGHAVRYPSKP